jgi:hypothetical protein
MRSDISPGVGCCSNETSVIGVNASLFVGSCTALTATNFGSPAQESLNVYVVNPLTVTFTESSLEVTQGTSPWVVSGTVCATQCTTPWVVNVADWNGVAVGSPTAWGTAPTGNVVGTNSELFAGNTALTATGTSLNVNLTGGTVCVTQCTSPWVVSGTVTTVPPANASTNITQWDSVALGAPTTWGTAPTGNTVIGTNSELFAGGTALAATGTSLNVNITGGSMTVAGNLTNNNAAPNAFNLGVLPAIAETAYATITYTAGNQVLIAVDTHGAVWNDLGAVAGTAVVTAAAGVQKVGVSGATGASMDAPIGAGTAAANMMQVGGVYNSTIPALTTGQSVAVEVDTTGATYVNNEGRKKTYSCFASFTPVAGDIAVLSGNATTVVRITRIEVSMSTSGTAGVEQITLVKRSAADTGGTSAAMTAVPLDSAYAAASSAALSYTAAPALGTAVGTIRGVQFFDESASTTGANTWLWTFGDGRGGASCVVLRGTAQQLAINLAGVIATQTVTVSYEWTEE